MPNTLSPGIVVNLTQNEIYALSPGVKFIQATSPIEVSLTTATTGFAVLASGTTGTTTVAPFIRATTNTTTNVIFGVY